MVYTSRRRTVFSVTRESSGRRRRHSRLPTPCFLFSSFVVVDGPTPKYYMRFPNTIVHFDMPYGRHADIMVSSSGKCVGIKGKQKGFQCFRGSSHARLNNFTMKLKYEKINETKVPTLCTL